MSPQHNYENRRAAQHAAKDHGAHRDESGDDHLAGRRAVVLIVSTSAADGTAADLCGPLLREWLSGHGMRVDPVRVIPDGPAVLATLRELLDPADAAERPRFVLTSGGTGLNPDDVTPEATAAVLERTSPGIMHALWARGLDKTPTAVMSRGLAGHAGRTFVVNLPGSRGGVKDGMAVLDPLLDHISAQLEDVHGHADDAARQLPESGAGSVASSPKGAPSSGTAAASAAAAVGARAASSSGAIVCAQVTRTPLDPAVARAAVADPSFGAVVGFSGVIRDHDGGRSGVTGLEYSAHPQAGEVLRAVAEEIAEQHPDVRIWVAHRIGELAVGDSALEAAVAAAHRGQAFAACGALVDRIKERVPIWKRQSYRDGTHSWVGLQE